MEHEQIFPQAGLGRAQRRSRSGTTPARSSAGALAKANLHPHDIAAVGITNQRETAVVWDRTTGEPVYNAIVWQDTRTQTIVDELGALGGGAERYKAKVGLPLATYFSGPKVRWILDNVEGAREKAEAGDLVFGNMDTWVLWNLTGGVDGGVHVTDATNASPHHADGPRHAELGRGHRRGHGHPAVDAARDPVVVGGLRQRSRARRAAPASRSPASSATSRRPPSARPASSSGEAKNTYGTGNFMLLNTGTEKVPVEERPADHGLLQDRRPADGLRARGLDRGHRLAGAVAARQPRHDLARRRRSRTLAKTVDDNGGAYFVPAFSGLFAPYWRSDARGALVGLTRYVNKGHIARAVLEATAFQTREVLDAMNADSGVRPDRAQGRRRHGRQRDRSCSSRPTSSASPVVRPKVAETTALGAAYAAGLAVGFWAREDDIRNNWAEDKRWDAADGRRPSASRHYRNWKKAVTKTFDWVES